MAKKEKKERITYIDDGRALADMSDVGGHRVSRPTDGRPPVRFRDAWKTYWGAVKMMLPAMLVFIVGMGLVYLILWLIFTLG